MRQLGSTIIVLFLIVILFVGMSILIGSFLPGLPLGFHFLEVQQLVYSDFMTDSRTWIQYAYEPLVIERGDNLGIISPDGRYMIGAGAGLSRSLRILNRYTDEVTTPPLEGKYIELAKWMPDSQHIVFVAYASSARRQGTIMVADVRDGRQQPLGRYDDARFFMSPYVLRDGATFVLIVTPDKTQIVNLVTSTSHSLPYLLTPDNQAFKWSFDGRWFAANSSTADTIPRLRLFHLSEERIVDASYLLDDKATYRWSEDNRYFIGHVWDGQQIQVAVYDVQRDIWHELPVETGAELIKISPGNDTIMLQYAGNHLVFVETATMTVIRTLMLDIAGRYTRFLDADHVAFIRRQPRQLWELYTVSIRGETQSSYFLPRHFQPLGLTFLDIAAYTG
jgi:hypothetical protein